MQDGQIKIKVTTSDLIAARKKEFLETNMNNRKLYDRVQDDFKNVRFAYITIYFYRLPIPNF